MKKLFFAFFLLFSLFLTSCSDKIMGYSVVLWTIPEHNIPAGEILPVYIKSNISHVYIVEKADGSKIEIPLWQMTEPVKKNKKETPVFDLKAAVRDLHPENAARSTDLLTTYNKFGKAVRPSKSDESLILRGDKSYKA